MAGSYQEFTRPGKDLTTGDQIASGAIELRHFSAALFSEFRQIQLHPHTGVKSVRVKLQDLDGYFPKSGFVMYSSDGAEKYRVTIDSGTNAFVITQI